MDTWSTRSIQVIASRDILDDIPPNIPRSTETDGIPNLGYCVYLA